MFKIINKFSYFKNILYKISKINDQNISLLGRWCHINMPKCNHDVVLKKIDMANQDNNFCYKPKKC